MNYEKVIHSENYTLLSTTETAENVWKIKYKVLYYIIKLEANNLLTGKQNVVSKISWINQK